jgi:hypothetical protein
MDLHCASRPTETWRIVTIGWQNPSEAEMILRQPVDMHKHTVPPAGAKRREMDLQVRARPFHGLP